MNYNLTKEYFRLAVSVRWLSIRFKSNYYQVLGVDRSSSFKEIREAYIKKSKEYHPDSGHKLNLSDEHLHQKFQEVNQAYQVLNNALKKEEYDNYLDSLARETLYRGYSRTRPKMSKEEYDFHLRYGFREGPYYYYSNRSYYHDKGQTVTAQAGVIRSWEKVKKITTWIFVAAVLYHIVIYIIFKYAFNPSKKQVDSLMRDNERARS